MPEKYEQVYDGEWFAVPWRRYQNQCCGCGLVHDIDFRRVGQNLETRYFVNARATAAVRREQKKRKRKNGKAR